MRVVTITTYDVVKMQTRKKFRCAVCGRLGTRSTTFRQTINPFNKNAMGQPKTYDEIWAELQDQAAAWQPDTHAGCEE